jgi:hypothetical protein
MKRVGERRLTWADRLCYLAIAALLIYGAWFAR